MLNIICLLFFPLFPYPPTPHAATATTYGSSTLYTLHQSKSHEQTRPPVSRAYYNCMIGFPVHPIASCCCSFSPQSLTVF